MPIRNISFNRTMTFPIVDVAPRDGKVQMTIKFTLIEGMTVEHAESLVEQGL
jgi:hypothetical protein